MRLMLPGWREIKVKRMAIAENPSYMRRRAAPRLRLLGDERWLASFVGADPGAARYVIAYPFVRGIRCR